MDSIKLQATLISSMAEFPTRFMDMDPNKVEAFSLVPESQASRVNNLYPNNLQQPKGKAIFVLGSTGSGKSKLAIYLATKFNGEVINSDKIQVHKGLDIVTNKVTDDETCGVPHHLIGILDPDAEFTISDFCEKTKLTMGSILDRGNIPIIAGGSNRYIEALMDHGDILEFENKDNCCFLWVYVSLPVLKKFVYERVDQMVEAGLVNEVHSMFRLDGDYSKGIRRSIGVPELDAYFRAKTTGCEDEKTMAALLEEGISMIKSNTYDLACRQFEKIKRLKFEKGWNIHLLDATEVILKRGNQREQEWLRRVAGPSKKVVRRFLYGDKINEVIGDD